VALEQQAANVFRIARHLAKKARQQIHDPRYRIVLFGSRARGRTRERSDIDIGLVGPAPVDLCIMDSIRASAMRWIPFCDSNSRRRSERS